MSRPPSDARAFPFSVAGLDRAGFVARFGGVYEHSPWAAERVHAQGLGAKDQSVAHLAGRLAATVDSASDAEKRALLEAHPELAGKLAVAGALTADSTREQAGAGLDQCTPAEFEEFQRLNAEYGARFGHPFIIAVAGLDRHAILEAFRRRIANTPDAEFATALAEVHKIARFRLERIADG